MSWTDQVFRYCERGQDPAFWAEPLNALSNAGFLVVAAIGAARIVRRQNDEAVSGSAAAGSGSIRLAVAALVALVAAIGIGSFLFHTFATRWSRLADVLPIGVFMLVYLVFALRVFLDWRWRSILLCLGAFLVASGLAASITCPTTRLQGVAAYAREPCLNGTMAYAPALAALLLVGALVKSGHPAGRILLAAAGVFLVAMLMRWLDKRGCAFVALVGRPRGTHALWHMLNAVTLHLLLTAAIAATPARAHRALTR